MAEDGLNKVMLLGRLGQDPELRMTNSGTPVLKMRLATTETYFDQNKQKQERTEWHSVTVWGKRAEGLGKFLTKGMRIFVEGGLRTSSYDDRDGNKRYRTEITASNVIVAGSGHGDGQQRSSQQSSAPSGGGGYSDADYPEDDTDIPF